MQSIKNTSVAIMLLFLSYGVYQVVMRPLPEAESGDSIESLDVMDPGEELAMDESPAAVDSFPSPPADSSVSIPPRLLELSGPQSRAALNSNTEENQQFSAPVSSKTADQNLSFDAASETESAPRSPTDIASMSESSNARWNSEEIEMNSGSLLESDTQIVPTADMVDVAPGDVARQSDASASLSQISREDAAAPTLSESWPGITALVEEADYQQALRLLTQFYRSEQPQSPDRRQMLDWLDALAAKVVYSSEHHLRSIPYIIQPGDTIASLARQWRVPAQLIYNVNTSKIPDPNELTPGVELKLIEGPFNAEIDSATKTLTLFLDDLYAGRFQIEPSPGIESGEFVIVDKSAQDRIDRPFCINLNNGVLIYGADEPPVENDEVGLKPAEAEEIFSILSAASKVRILR